MAEISITNDGKNNKYVGSICILPGETKILDDSLFPMLRKPAPQAEPEQPTDPITELLAKKVPEIVAALPGLSDDDVSQLFELENESAKPRTSLLKALSEEAIRRAGEKVDEQTAGPDADQPQGDAE